MKSEDEEKGILPGVFRRALTWHDNLGVGLFFAALAYVLLFESEFSRFALVVLLAGGIIAFCLWWKHR